MNVEHHARFELADAPGGVRLAIFGDWTAVGMGRAPERLVQALRGRAVAHLDGSGLHRLDLSGVCALAEKARVPLDLLAATPGGEDLAALARLALVKAPSPPDRGPSGLFRAPILGLASIGRGVHFARSQFLANLVFYGRLIASAARLVVQPARFRPAATFSQMQRAGLEAAPIVAATNFFVGATIAFLGASLLAQFGAAIFTVELVGVGVLREFAVIITAVILAGRSASSFAAEIGAMRMNQEVDAMQVMGVDPFDALVLPRFAAMLTMTPLLTFIGVLAGLLGGMMITWVVIDLSPLLFLTRMIANVGVRHLWLGLVKAPVMAMVIASIGCRQGMEVGGDVEQLGRHVTQAVVQALFAIIMLDAVFALAFMELNL